MRVTLLFVLSAVLAAGDQQGSRRAVPGAHPDYVLGAEDELELVVADSEEFLNRKFVVSGAGEVALPLIGAVQAGGLTTRQFEAAVKERLRRFIKNPDVVVTVKEFHSRPVSVLGAVKNPGIHQMRSQSSLSDVLALAGGMTDEAGRTVGIARAGACPDSKLPRSSTDANGVTHAEVSVKEILRSGAGVENIRICPHDTITVPRAEVVYVVGEVARPGGFPLNERSRITSLQALALAGGLTQYAGPKNARILRVASPDGKRTEIPVDLRRVLDGRAEDVTLQPEDMLFVPDNVPKKVAVRAAEAAVQTISGVVIWRGAR